MGMGQEFKDFINGFDKGYKLATPSEEELKAQERERNRKGMEGLAAPDLGAINSGRNAQPHTYGSGDTGMPNPSLQQKADRSIPVFAQQAGMGLNISPSYMKTTALVESDANPGAVSSTGAKGPYQFTGGTARRMGLNDPTDWGASSRATAQLAAQNRDALKAQLGRDVSDEEIYLAHNQGAAGAGALLRDPNANATQALARAYKGDVGKAAQALRVNGVNPDMTAGQAVGVLTAKYRRKRVAALDTGEDETQPTVMAAEGGAIGPVMKMPELPDTPAAPPLPPRRPSDAELQSVPKNTEEDPDHHRVAGLHEALDAGMGSIARTFGFDGQTSALPNARSDRDANIRRYHANEGAATPDEVAQIDRKIDPGGRLTEDARAVARLNAGYRWFLMQGEPEKAKKYAESMLLYTRHAVQMHGAQAEQKLRAGDVAGAADSIQRGHNQIPDGSTLYVDKVNPDGSVDYRVQDEDGDLTERGKAYANQLMHIATGMQNGSQWLEGIQTARGNSLTAAQKLAEKRRVADEKAYGSYLDAGGGNQDVVGKLSPEAQDALKKMSPAVRARAIQELVARDQQARAQAGAERAQAKDERRQDFYERREQAQDKKGRDQQEYAGHAAAVENARDALAEQMQADPDDTEKVGAAQKALKDAVGAGRAWAAQDTGRAAYVPQLERIARPAGRGGGGSGGRGGTEDERKVAGLDQQFTRLQRAADREADPEQKARLQAQLPHHRASIEFQKRDTGYSDDIGTKVDQALPGVLGVKEGTALSDAQETDSSDYGTAMTGMLRGDNALSPKRAGDLAKLAVKTGKIELLDNGAYSINGSDPVFMPPQAVAALARLRQRTKKDEHPVKRVPNPFEPDAESTMTPNEVEGAQASAAARAAREADAPGRRLRNKSAEYGRLKEQMGEEMYARVQKQLNKTDDSVPLAMMRRIVRERARGAAFGRDYSNPL